MNRDARRAAEVRVAARLAAAGVPNAEVDARWLVDHVVEVTGDPTGCGGALLDGLVERRAAREPLQLVIGRTWFRTLELACAPGVFVPRPETEVVAGLAIDAARAAAVEAPDGRVLVVDACTGTGAIALSLGVEVPGARVVAGDVSAAALELARRNLDSVVSGVAGDRLAPGSSVSVVASDLLDGVDDTLRGRLDVLVSNPPYLPAFDRGTWDPEVGGHDPDGALVGGTDGHEVVDTLLRSAADWLRPGGVVVLEIDSRRGTDALALARRFGLVNARVVPDLTGRDRAVVARNRRCGGSSSSR